MPPITVFWGFIIHGISLRFSLTIKSILRFLFAYQLVDERFFRAFFFRATGNIIVGLCHRNCAVCIGEDIVNTCNGFTFGNAEKVCRPNSQTVDVAESTIFFPRSLCMYYHYRYRQWPRNRQHPLSPNHSDKCHP